MEQTRFDFTPEQQALLVALSRETGKPIPTLLAEALEGLQEHAHRARAAGGANGHETAALAAAPPAVHPPIWDAFIAASLEIPEEELALLPTDGATQHDHYLYGTPKRPV